jgi:antitoxin FitA
MKRLEQRQIAGALAGYLTRRAKSACEGSGCLRTRRTQAATTLATSASSKATWPSISASVVASTRAQSVRRSTGSQGPAEHRRDDPPRIRHRAFRLYMRPTCFYVRHMSVMIQIRNVPDALHRRLKSRAALAGMSLSDYLLAELRRIADWPTVEELRERLAQRSPTNPRISPEEAVRAERDAE